MFCARGPSDTPERQCFAFTCSHGDSPENSIFQCHVFRCDIPEAVPKILYCFGNTFRRVPKHRQLSEGNNSAAQKAPLDFLFTVTLDFREDDGKGNYSACPKDKDVFKFKVNTEKLLQISVQQSGPQEIRIERCFGLLISPGRNVQHSDMQLIELMSMAYAPDTRQYNISGHWDPSEKCFAILNTETEKDTRVFLTVAVDLVLVGIQEPVRFTLETKAKIYAVSERFWYLSRKAFSEQFNVCLKQVKVGPEPTFEVVKVESQTEKERRTHNLNLNLSGTNRAPVEPVMTPQEEAEDSEGDEPLLSGSGVVSKEVTDEELLATWAEVLTRWHANLATRPKQVTQLCRKTVPEALRGEVWQLLAGCTDSQNLLEAYRVLITKDSPSDAVIQRDINRTFPAHDFFKDAGGQGQDSLYRISKAYSVYDEEIGYVQGLSFLAAALLLHMPEEQAFCVLVKIMYDYQLRKLFKHGFLELHLKFYQLERLMQDQLPDLYDHFVEMGLEIHMFASQWFLTLFTAKFPLHVVFGILDLFLSEGNLTIFCVALALLKSSRKELLSHEFEGVLKYFRVHLPKKYRSESSARELMACAVGTKVSSRKLKKYEKEYQTIQEQNLQQEDPLERYERENKRLLEDNLRLERENDDLGHELVDTKLTLNSRVDALQDHNEELERELKGTTKLLRDTEDEKKRLEAESKSAKVKACPDCASVFDGDKLRLSNNPKEKPEDPDISELQKQIRELELELAQTKLALVESECKTQDLTHQLSAAVAEISTASRSTWLTKTLSSIREAATNKKEPKE
ncbi:rab GTPase-activating protein 1 [Elysia marginata]|uniref:Rab GTPase-activating protein 1 n=1 Tax=Elysia marginata TaxID=1093978 RepID=A0AAV4IYP2_9GAST|nr:rab GTPase-activating protein 1 [Elysia marginata]